MGVLITLTFGLMLWIVGWALGYEAFNMFLVAIALVAIAFTLRTISPFVKSQLGR